MFSRAIGSLFQPVFRAANFSTILGKHPKFPLPPCRVTSIFHNHSLSLSRTSSCDRPITYCKKLDHPNNQLTTVFQRTWKGEKEKSNWNNDPLVFLGILAVPFAMTCKEICQRKEEQKSILNSSLEGIEWVKECLRKHPELQYLIPTKVWKDENGSAGDSYSEQLFKEHVVEFENTIHSLQTLRLIYKGDHESLVKEGSLSAESFEELHKQMMDLLDHNPFDISRDEMLQTMTTAIVLASLAKSPEAIDRLDRYGISHHRLYEGMIQIFKKNSGLSPSFDRLSKQGQELLETSTNLLSFDQVYHLEGGPMALFKRSIASAMLERSPERISFQFLLQSVLMAGNASFGITQNNYSVLTGLRQAFLSISMSPFLMIIEKANSIHQTIIESRARELYLRTDERKTKTLVIFASMLEFFGKEKGEMLLNAFRSMNQEQRDALIQAFEMRDHFAKAPLQLSNFLRNLYTNEALGDSEQERLNMTILFALRILPGIFQQYENSRHFHWEEEKQMNFEYLARLAASENPYTLLQEWKIEKSGWIKPKHFDSFSI